MTKKPDDISLERSEQQEWPMSSEKAERPLPQITLEQLSQALLTACSLEDVLHACLEVIVPTKATNAAILLAGGSPDDRYLEVVASGEQKYQNAFSVGSRFSTDERLFHTLWVTGQSVVVNDATGDERISEHLRSALIQADVRALVALPLRSEQKYLGAVLVTRPEPQPFSSQNVRTYDAVVSLARGAIEKLRLIQEAKQESARTSALYEISHRLLKSQSINDILQNVLDAELFGAAGGTIALLEPASPVSTQPDQELVFWAVAGSGSEKLSGLRIPVSEGVVGWVVRNNEPALVLDAYADERFYHQIDQAIDFRTHSILCAPLRTEERVIGAIELVDVRQEYLSDEGVRLLEQVADQAALLIQNQRLLNETQRQARELSMLLEVSQDLTSTLEREKTLHLISSRVLDLVKADGCHIFLLEPGRDGEDLLVPVVSSDRYEKQILSTPLKIGQGITGRVAQSGTGIVANRVDLDSRGFHVPDTPREPESLISVPLVSEDRRIGVMTVSRLGEEVFDENDLRIVSAAASQTATVLEKARLFKEAQQRSQELAALNAVVSTASQSLTLEEILNATLERVTEIMPVSAGLICLHDRATNELRLATQRDLSQSLVRRFEKEGMHKTLCALTAQTGQAYLVPDLTCDNAPSLLPGAVDTATLVSAGLHTYLGTPLVAQGQVLGTLSVFGSEPNTFGSADTALLTAIGQQVGIAVHNAQLYAQAEHALEESTALYDASQAISNTLELKEALQVTVKRMTEYVGADQGLVVLYDNVLGYGRVMAEYHPTPGIESVHIPMAGNLSYEFLRDRGAILCIEDVRTHPITEKGSEILIDDDVKSMLLVPLLVQGRLTGSVILYSTDVHRTFTKSEISFCRTLADHAALAIENRRLFSQTFHSLQETTLLYQASRALNQAQILHDVLYAITDNLFVKQIDQCWIALIDRDLAHDQDSQILAVEINALWDHEDDRRLLGRRFTARELPLFVPHRPAEPRVIEDLDNETNLDNQSIATLQNLGIKSALIVPLMTGESLLGWLVLITHHHTHVFDPDQIRPYQALADQAAVAIRNQQLLRQVQDSLAEVRAVHRQYLRDEWTSFLQSREDRLTAFEYDHGNLLPGQDFRQSLTDEAVGQGTAVIRASSENAHHDNGPSDEQVEDTGQATGPVEHRGGTSLVTPLMVRGQVIGTLGLEDPEQAHEWTTEELSLVQEIADRVAQAVENARLLEETQVSLTETERLYKAASRLANADNADEIIRVLAEEIQAALGSDFSGSILRADPEAAGSADWLEASALWDSAEITYPQGTRFAALDYPALSQLVGQRESLLIQDIDLEPGKAFPAEALNETQPHALLTIPLVAGSSWLGVINVVSQNEGTPDSRTMRFLHDLADRAAMALESVRLYAETQRYAVQLEASTKVSRAATSILQQDELLSSVVELIRDHFDYYHAQVFLLDPTERWAVLEASTGEAGQKLLNRGYALEVGGDSLIGYVTATGETRNAYGLSGDPSHSEYLDLTHAGSEVAIPLKIGGRVIGALNVQSMEPAAFGPDETAVLSTLADQVAITIENARLYQEQLETTEKLREVDRLKTQFLANISHELRTPLNSIIGFSRVILKGIDGPITELQKQDLNAIYSSGQLLLRLINDILDLSKIEAGKMELVFEETDLKEIIKDVLSAATALVKDKPEIELRQNVAADLPLIIADATRLRQVLLNLFSNAAKFTHRGHIELRATRDGRFVIIQVSDTGVGVPPDKFDLIFEEFEQVDGSTTRVAGGTGLGLPISRRFVEMHGGSMWVESEVGVGSTFAVQLPIKGPQAVEETQEETARASSRRLILAIDDDADVITLYRRYLEKRNYQVIGLSDSEFAVQKTRELRPYAVLLDLLLPKKDGWAVIQELRTDPETQDIPIIMCSIVSAAGRGFSLGAADFLVKPITEERLMAALARLEDGADRSPGEPRRVLIIDDTREDRRLLRRALETAVEPYQVVEASGGLEGIKIIQQRQPDLVILDLMMPEMDGFAVIESLKSDKEMRQIPIIIVTAKELTTQEQDQINGQVAALFHKGLFKEEELLQDVNQALRRVRGPLWQAE